MRQIIDQLKLEWGLGKRKFLAFFLWPLAFFAIVGVAFSADPYTVIPSTPDISVGASSTVDVKIPGGRADFFAIKNDCSSTLYFSIWKSTNAASIDYFLRLDSNESFTADMIVYGIGASPASGNSAACAFTLILGRY